MKRGIDYVGISAVTICHDGAGNYLLGRRSDKCRDEHFRWDLIGSGGLEFGETLLEAVQREVKEETGAEVVAVDSLGFREVLRRTEEGETHYIAFDFRVEVDRNQAVNAEPEKCLEIEWFSLDAFPKPMHSQWPVFFEKYKDKL